MHGKTKFKPCLMAVRLWLGLFLLRSKIESDGLKGCMHPSGFTAAVLEWWKSQKAILFHQIGVTPVQDGNSSDGPPNTNNRNGPHSCPPAPNAIQQYCLDQNSKLLPRKWSNLVYSDFMGRRPHLNVKSVADKESPKTILCIRLIDPDRS